MLRDVLKFSLWGVSIIYLGSIWLVGAGHKLPSQTLPAPVLYLTQVSCLFPRAAVMTIEYRAEGQRCDGTAWEEIDTRPHFPIRADDKENRYHRALFFHRRRANVMTELDDYMWSRLPHGEYGRLRFLSLRIPFPETRHEVTRFERKPLEEYPEEQRKHWWTTPTETARARCTEGAK